MNKQCLDYRLYLVTDRNLMSQSSLIDTISQAIDGGITMLQLREKKLSSQAFLEEALAVKTLAKDRHIPLIINDRVDIALACQADGVHIGQHDLPLPVVRSLIGADKIIGVSVQTLDQAIIAEKQGADYLGVGAMFPTKTKEEAIIVDHETLAKICQNVSLPIILIGGMTQQTIPLFQHERINGFAIVSEIMTATETCHVTQKYRQLIDQQLLNKRGATCPFLDH